MAIPPQGTTTFLFTDIEGSTTRWEQQPEAMRGGARPPRRAPARGHRRPRRLRSSRRSAMPSAPPSPPPRPRWPPPWPPSGARRPSAWGAAGPLRVRMALHTGAAEERDGDYFGPPLNRVARLLAAGHGGQILLSAAAAGAGARPPAARTRRCATWASTASRT